MQPPPRLFRQLLQQQQQQQELQLLERCLLPRLRSATTRYVQVLLSPTSWVAAGADAAAAAAAREIDHQAELELELELLAATAAATLAGRWSILLKEMMKILERQTTTTTTMSAICNSLNPPKDLLTYLLTDIHTYIHAVRIMLQNFLQQMIIHTESINQSFLSLSKQTTVAHHRVMALPCVPPTPLKTLPL